MEQFVFSLLLLLLAHKVAILLLAEDVFPALDLSGKVWWRRKFRRHLPLFQLVILLILVDGHCTEVQTVEWRHIVLEALPSAVKNFITLVFFSLRSDEKLWLALLHLVQGLERLLAVTPIHCFSKCLFIAWTPLTKALYAFTSVQDGSANRRRCRTHNLARLKDAARKVSRINRFLTILA